MYALAAMDTISPWLVGRYSNTDDFQALFNSVVLPDITLTSSRSQEYAPNVFPGFSWTNLQRNRGSTSPLNEIPRNGGSFWSYQFSTFANDLVDPSTGKRLQYIFGAMFDEFDESTAMMKAASTIDDTPAEGTFLYLSIDGTELPSDYYLSLAGNYTAALNNQDKYSGKLFSGSHYAKSNAEWCEITLKAKQQEAREFHRAKVLRSWTKR